MMIDHGRNGDTSSASIVPVSFSRVSEIAVMSDARMVSTKAISPGTKMFELSRVGLNRMRVVAEMRVVRVSAAPVVSGFRTMCAARSCS